MKLNNNCNMFVNSPFHKNIPVHKSANTLASLSIQYTTIAIIGSRLNNIIRNNQISSI